MPWEVVLEKDEYVIRDTDAQRWADLMEIRINAKEETTNAVSTD